MTQSRTIELMQIHTLLILLGGLLLAGLVADKIGRLVGVPRVTILILFGVAAGPFGIDLIPRAFSDLYEILATIALTMVAFLLGGSLSSQSLRRHGHEIMIVSLVVVAVTTLVVGSGLLILGVAAPLALVMAGIATSTAPAATYDVIRQSRASGDFTTKLVGIVAIDDAWGLIVFSMLLAVANAISGEGIATTLMMGSWEIVGAILVGIAVGAPAAYLTGRLKPGEPMQAEAIGVVFLCAGLASWIGASFLLAGMVAGACVVNLAQHHDRAFHEIENIEWPFMIIFFILAGASLDFTAFAGIGTIGAAFVVLRFVSRIAGGWLGGWLAGSTALHRRMMGLALMPQAGIALGMALVAKPHLADYADLLIVITIGSVFVFEMIGPILTQMALRRAGDIQS